MKSQVIAPGSLTGAETDLFPNTLPSSTFAKNYLEIFALYPAGYILLPGQASFIHHSTNAATNTV
jgi:hypothetical protein